ncbi:MAG: CaiB/BaiF CoA transferase family protein [Sphingobium sp.]
MEQAEEPRALLQGIRVIDMTTIVFGPYATRLLADMGADVVKVETPGGDQFRQAGKPAVTRGMGGCHMTLNRGKRSVELDLKAGSDRETLRAMLADADIFIHNVRASAIDRLGFSYEAVKAIRPDILYIHCVGFGSDGPYAGLQAYDDVIQAASGAASLMSKVDGNPSPRYIPSTIADKVAGLHAAYAMTAALVHRLRTGEGQHVEVPMFEAFTHFLLEEHLFSGTFIPPTGPIGYGRQLDPDRQPFPTADGHISIVPYTDASWVALLGLMGRGDLLEDARFATPRDRARNIADLYRTVAAMTPSRSTADWTALLADANIPAMAVRDLADIVNDPHLAQSGFFARREHPSEGPYLEMRPPVRFGAAPDLPRRPAPRLGEHDADFKTGKEA